MQIFVYFFDMNYLLTYVIVGFFWIAARNSPWWAENLTPLFEQVFFSVDHLHPLLKRGSAINTLALWDVSSVRNLDALIKDEKRYTKLAEIKEMYSIPTKSAISQYQDAIKGTAFTL